MSTIPTPSRFGGSALTIGICVVLAILGFLLLTEHQAHVFGLLPYLLLLACPVIHLLTHGRHGTNAHAATEPHGLHEQRHAGSAGSSVGSRPDDSQKGGRS